ncbi:nucleotidyltransferase domain-containing protein [Pseudonocardia sp.]|uniref:type VII toxin-antitoxin system MntA family adenylyltransferase antitoxin n=1 Tax=Pseudonocardia sp. TaxID=60912 RepID=UPI0026224722|nr:nucleotidyltransferase domain-containing protein [Pseudonocardia sp.]
MDAEVETLSQLLAPAFAADPRVRFAFAFGSVADGTARPGSDLDLAVSVDPRGTLLDDARLHDALARAAGRDDVDLVVCEDAPLWMQFRIVAGRPVFSRDDVARVRFRASVEQRFLDFRPFHDAYLGAVRDRARTGGLSRG